MIKAIEFYKNSLYVSVLKYDQLKIEHKVLVDKNEHNQIINGEQDGWEYKIIKYNNLN